MESERACMSGVLAMIAQLYGVEKLARQKQVRGEALRLLRCSR